MMNQTGLNPNETCKKIRLLFFVALKNLRAMHAHQGEWRLFACIYLLVVAARAEQGPAGCDVSSCETLGQRNLACSLDTLLGQHVADRKLVAATFNLKHPVQTYLISANPFPPGYATLDDPAVQGVFELLPAPALDYCYTVQRGKNFASDDVVGLIKKMDCAAPGALPFNASTLRLRSVFVNQHGGDYMNSLHAYTCEAHFLFGGCNENIALSESPSVLQGVDRSLRVHRAVSIATRWGSSYYHWLLEELPRLAYVLPQLRADPSMRIITHDHRANRRIFEWLGLDPARVLPTSLDQMFFVDDLLVPPVAHCGRPALTAARLFREELFHALRAAGIITIAPAKRSQPLDDKSDETAQLAHQKSSREAHNSDGHIVVIARGGSRHTVNHGQLMVALRTGFPDRVFVEYGPNFVDLQETARIFGNARGVVGVHGAGMTNMIFSPSSAFLVEFHPHESNQVTHPNICHQGSADAFGQRHHMVWLTKGAFNDGVTIPPSLAIAAICKFDGGPDATCKAHTSLGSPAGPSFLTRE
jgi:hypothetical protein